MAKITTLDSSLGWKVQEVAIAPQESVPDTLPLLSTRLVGSAPNDDLLVRVLYVDDAPAQIVSERDCLDEASPELAETLIQTLKLGQLIRVSSEQYRQHQTSKLLAESAGRAIHAAANEAFLNLTAPAQGEYRPTGILNTPGIGDAGVIGPCLDKLIQAEAFIADAGGQATTIVISPSAWAELLNLKTDPESCQPLIGFTESSTGTGQKLLGCDVLVTNAMPAGQGLIFDKRGVLSVLGNVRVLQQDDVKCDAVNLAIYWRFGWVVVHPDWLVRFAVTTGGDNGGSTRQRKAKARVPAPVAEPVAAPVAEAVIDDAPFTDAVIEA